MKFGERLASLSTPEWRSQYLQYNRLKTMLYDIVNSTPRTQDEKVLTCILKEKQLAFLKSCDEELVKTVGFYKQKFTEIDLLNNALRNKLNSALKTSALPSKNSSKWSQKLAPNTFAFAKTVVGDEDTKNLKQLKTDFSTFYFKLVLLHNYQEVNKEGFRKILKKYDKMLYSKKGSKWYKKNVETSPLAKNDVDRMITATEDSVTEYFENGNRQAAMKLLRVPAINESTSVWTIYFLGFTMSGFLLLLTLILYTLTTHRLDEPRWVGIRLFRGYCMLFTYLIIMSVNMYIWQKNGVNHILIFEINPRDHLTWQGLMLIASSLLMLWSVFVLGYLYAPIVKVPRTVFPLLFLAVCILWLCQPFRCNVHSARRWFMKRVLFCFMAPFRGVTFPDFWFADQMTTLVAFFLDMEYTVCFYANYVKYSDGSMSMILRNLSDANSTFGINPVTGNDLCMSNIYGIRPIVSCVPALIRFLQCVRRFFDKRQKHPHLSNAGKYSTVFFIVLFGSLNTLKKKTLGDNPFFYMWIFAYVISFVYTFSWDMIMDWGLFDRKAKNKILRDELIYGLKGYYYAGMVTDFVLRFAWVVNVSLGDHWSTEHDLWIMITTPFECFRRFVWNLFRLENEHVNNCGGFRETVNINVKPMSSIKDDKDEDSATEIMKADEKRKRKKKKKEQSTATKSIDTRKNAPITLQTIIADMDSGSSSEAMLESAKSSRPTEELPLGSVLAESPKILSFENVSAIGSKKSAT